MEPGSALTLGGTFDATLPRGWVRSSALAVLGLQASASAQFMIAGSADLRSTGSMRPFVSASGGAFAVNGSGASASGDLSAGVRYATGRYGVSFSGAGGAMSHQSASSTLLRAQSDAWVAIGYEQFGAEASVTSSGARYDPLAHLNGQGSAQQYFDAAGSWRHEQGPFAVGVAVGARNETVALRGGVWHSVDAELWLRPGLALVVSGANTLADVLRGIPRTTVTTVAFRFASRPHVAIARASARDGPRMSVLVSGESRRIQVAGVRAERVELMADFTEWDPVVLDRDAAGWHLDRAVAPGPHRVVIRVNGGDWIVPANLPRAEDDFGGQVGLITIP